MWFQWSQSIQGNLEAGTWLGPSQSAYSQPLDLSDWFIHRWLKSFSQFRNFCWNYWARDTDFLPELLNCECVGLGLPGAILLSKGKIWQRMKPTQKESRTKNGARLSPDNVIWLPSPSCVWGQANPWTFKFCGPTDFPPLPTSLSWVLTFASD